MGETHDDIFPVDRACVMSDLEEKIDPESEAKSKSHCRLKVKSNSTVLLCLINFTIREGEKIRVVGRTGIGKSALIVALEHFADISERNFL
jgi:ABC-type transport system involved in cytochrome bd biosynthesis fused ATPase/permease subunit